jgi:hypothetical protein
MDGTWRRWSLCGAIVCGTMIPSAVPAGVIPWPWEVKYPPRMTQRRAEKDAYYAARAYDPIGARQIDKKGKLWPPYPRPTGPANLPSHLYHAEHYWPHPYVCQDRDFVRDLSAAQTSNGWVTMTTLYDYHFDETHQLNESGRMQLRWILENAPAKHRYAFVQAGIDNATSQARMSAVKIEATQLVGADQAPPVLIRMTSPLGRPAEEVDAIRRKERQSIVDPRITPPIGTNNLGASQASGQGT